MSKQIWRVVIPWKIRQSGATSISSSMIDHSLKWNENSVRKMIMRELESDASDELEIDTDDDIEGIVEDILQLIEDKKTANVMKKLQGRLFDEPIS